MNGFWKRKCDDAKEKERKSQKVVVRKNIPLITSNMVLLMQKFYFC